MKFLHGHVRSIFAQFLDGVEDVALDLKDGFVASFRSHVCPVTLVILVWRVEEMFL